MVQRIKQSTGFVFLFTFMSFSMFNSIQASFWAYFMTDVVGISAVIMGSILVISRTLDWFLAPVGGIIVEKSNLKWGKYRSWLILASPLILVCFILMFTNPSLPLGMKAVYLGGAYVIAAIFINLNIISVSTLIPAVGKTQEDRVMLAARKGQGSTAAKIIFGVTALPLILLVNGGEKAKLEGFLVACILYGLFFVLMNFLLFRQTKGLEDQPVQNKLAKKENSTSVKEMFVLLFTNPPLLTIVVTESARYVAQMTLMGMAAYYFNYAFQNMALMAVMLTVMNFVGLGGTIAVEFISRKVDKKFSYIIGMVIMIVCLLLAWMIARDPVTYIVLISIGMFGYNFMNGTSLAIQSDTVLYSEWKTGKQAKAFLMSAFQWTPKIGQIAAGAITGFGLASIGYVKGIESTPELVSGMNNMINLVPAICLTVGLVFMLLFYKLNKAKMVEIQQDLQNKKEAAV